MCWKFLRSSTEGQGQGMKFKEPYLFEVEIKEIGTKRYIELDEEIEMAIGKGVKKAVIGFYEAEP